MNSDRNLLVGILARQLDLISDSQLLEAMHTWVGAKSRHLEDLLFDQKAIDRDTRQLLAALLDKHLALHGDVVEQSLASLSSIGSLRNQLHDLADPQLEQSLSRVSIAPPSVDVASTQSFSVGHHSSAGNRFRIVRPHARGGLGEVSIAVDEELHREVALKEIRPHRADDPASRNRFILEAEITGGLEHPGIVPVYGLGQYADGRPFYAMRFIRGASLKQAVDQFHGDKRAQPDHHSVAFRQLLGRFIDVCNAVEYAHSRGVLHRDLKPGNIMLGKYGETLVVDWGLAKPLGRSALRNPQPADGEASLRPSGSGFSDTQMGTAVGTPAFMSPEQAEGRLDELGSHSDVYSLGATLYYVLTGRAPFRAETVKEILRAVGEGHFPRPREVNPGLPRPLEAICLKAMSRDPARRYATVGALADDVERHLAEEPVAAYPEPLRTRVWRWSRRHKGILTSAAVVLVFSLAALAVATVSINEQKQLAEAARTRAEQNFVLARKAVDRYYTQVSENALLDVPHLQPLRQELLTAAGEFYEQFLQQAGDDPEVQAELANAYLRLGNITAETGSLERALELAEKARVIYDVLAAQHPADLELRRGLAASHRSLGQWHAAVSQLDSAGTALRKAAAIQESLVTRYPGRAVYRFDLAQTQGHVGALYARLGQLQMAETAYQQAVDALLDLELATDQNAAAEYQHQLAVAYSHLGSVYRDTQRFSDTEQVFEKARVLAEQLVSEHPGVAAYRSHLAAIHNDLGFVFSTTSQFPRAAQHYKNALQLLETLTRDYPDVANYRIQRGRINLNLGLVFDSLGNRAGAFNAYQQAVADYDLLSKQHPEVPDHRHALAKGYNSIAILHHRIGEMNEAEQAYQRALDLWQPLAERFPDSPDYPLSLASVQFNLGLVASNTERFELAEKLLKDASTIRAKWGTGPDATLESRMNLATNYVELAILYARTNRVTEAETSFLKAQTVAQELAQDYPSVPDVQSYLAATHNNLAFLYTQTNELGKAQNASQKAIPIYQKLVVEHPEVPSYRSQLAQAHNALADVLHNQGSWEPAQEAFEQSVTLLESLVRDHPDIVEYSMFLSRNYRQLAWLELQFGDAEQALSWVERARTLLDKVLQRNARDSLGRQSLADALICRSEALSRLGRHSQALESWSAAADQQVTETMERIDLGRAASLARQGDHARAVADAEETAEKHSHENPAAAGHRAYWMAQVYALAATAARRDDDISEDQREKLAEQYSSRGMAMLRQARQSGLLNQPIVAHELAESSDFAPLRARSDFAEILSPE